MVSYLLKTQLGLKGDLMSLNRYILVFIILFMFLIIPAVSSEDNDTQSFESNQTDTLTVNTYYFDSNAVKDGIGTFDSPYNKFTSRRLKSNSIFYLADGEYSLSASKSLSNIEIHGTNSLKTVFKTNGYILSLSGNCILNNLTLINSPLSNKGVLNVSNSVFKAYIFKPPKLHIQSL